MKDYFAKLKEDDEAVKNLGRAIIDEFKEHLTAPKVSSAQSPAAMTGLSAELINAIEQMALAINLAPDDNPCVTMHPRIWLLWEEILLKANIGPDINEGR